jgi:hypothetical protein
VSRCSYQLSAWAYRRCYLNEFKRRRQRSRPGTRGADVGGVCGGEAGTRTLRPRLSNLMMARDFWWQGFESQLLTGFSLSATVSASPRHSTGVVETFWRRSPGGLKALISDPVFIWDIDSRWLSEDRGRTRLGTLGGTLWRGETVAASFGWARGGG